MRSLLLVFILLNSVYGEKLSVNRQCRELLQCSIKKNCVQLGWIVDHFENRTINVQLYNDLDMGVDYGCLFTSGCFDECNKCPLCMSSKQQLVDVLSGNKLAKHDDCHDLVNCATDCVDRSGSDLNMINHCLRHTCAFHCFNGSCQKCSAFITRIFNQICVSGNLRNKVQGFKGQCFELFRDIVYAKFRTEFDKKGIQPAIGHHQAN